MAVGSMGRRICRIGRVQLGPEVVLPIENVLEGHVSIPWIPLTQAVWASLPSISRDEVKF